MRSRRERHALTGIVIAIAAICFIMPFAQRGSADDASPAPAAATTVVTAPVAGPSPGSTAVASEAPAAPDTAAVSPTDPPTTEVDVGGGGTSTTDTCLITVRSLGVGDQGSSVECLQQALVDSGFYSGPVNGQFDQATYEAVRRVQQDRDLFVDGVVGRESAISLGIWPEEASLVVHTPAPPPGAVDLMGYPLSSVATSGPDAPPLPENSGSGRRVVYDRAGQRVWAVDEDGTVIRSWLVSGSKYNNELPGVHEVYSRSEVSTAWNGRAYLPKMIRWLKTDIGNIGFHGIPTHVSDGSAYQTEAELGTRLSGGCQRQANRDAAFMWDFAQIGTKVVVI